MPVGVWACRWALFPPESAPLGGASSFRAPMNLTGPAPQLAEERRKAEAELARLRAELDRLRGVETR